MVNEDLINFPDGKIVYKRWRVITRVGAGGCGAVFKVQDINNAGRIAALKAEKNNVEDGSVLKLEIEVFKKLANKDNCMRMYQFGKRNKYSFLVMTLCGRDLMSIKRRLDEPKFSEGTILRVAVHALYAIKMIHDIGYVHRDVKPGNVVVGLNGRERKMLFLIDYGMVRSYVQKTKEGGYCLRPPRKKVLLRGTLRYCSPNVHNRMEQGRNDDLWSLVYMLTELYRGLPWNRDSVEDEIKRKKETLTDEFVFKDCPPEFLECAKYLRTLNYATRPDYYKIYEFFMSGVRRTKVFFSDPYEWEKIPLDSETEILKGKEKGKDEPDLNTGIEASEREKKTKKALPRAELDLKLFASIRPEKFKENPNFFVSSQRNSVSRNHLKETRTKTEVSKQEMEK